VHKGPVYLRLGREKTPLMTIEETEFRVGKAAVFRDGRDVTIVACGPLLHEALHAARILEKEGISAQVINNHTIKPIDKKTILSAARKTGAFVTVEDHQVNGGLGSAVAETISESYPVPVRRIGIQDRFGQSGTPAELLEEYGLTARYIAKAAEEAIALKESCAGRHPWAFEPVEAGKLLSEVAPDQQFHLWGGETIKTIPELEQALKKMNEATFRHHVNNQKNDFSKWIQDCFGDRMLAEELKKTNNRETMAELLRKRIRKAGR